MSGVQPPHRRSSPGTDRFLDLFSPSPPSGATAGAELLEDDVLFSPSPEPEPDASPADHGRRIPASPRILSSSRSASSPLGPRGFAQPSGLGILLAEHPTSSRLRLSSPSASAAARAIPKPSPDHPASFTSNKVFHQSAPVNVPLHFAPPRKPSGPDFDKPPIDDDEEDDDEMLPPHELVARRASVRNSPMTTFSVLEGAGRTLKGRDLRRVRNAVFRQTGFLD